MQVDYSVELGRDDPALEVPWSSEDAVSRDVRPCNAGSGNVSPGNVSPGNAAIRYYDLKADPAMIVHITEAASCPELRLFLNRINAAGFPLQTAKCDLWETDELLPEEEIFWETGELSPEEETFTDHRKCASYVDLIFASEEPRLSFEKHESLAKALCLLLQRVPEMPASAEFVLRRCYYHRRSADEDSLQGYCVTTYVSGYGNDESEARQRWAVAIKLVQHALVQWAGR